MTWDQFWPALPGLIALLATVIKIISDWRKGKAEATGIITDAAADVVTLLRGEVAEIKRDAMECKARIRRLEEQIRKLGAVPANGGDTA